MWETHYLKRGTDHDLNLLYFRSQPAVERFSAGSVYFRFNPRNVSYVDHADCMAHTGQRDLDDTIQEFILSD